MKIFITKIIPEAGLKLLKDAGLIITMNSERRNLFKEELISISKQNDIVLNGGFDKMDAAYFDQCQHLKTVSLMTVGYDNLDVAAATKYKIPVSNTPGVLSNATSDIAFLLMLAVSRNAQVVFLILMHDDDLAVALKKVVAFDARFGASRSGRDRAARSFHRIIHKYLSHRFS